MTDVAATEESKESASVGMLEKMAERLYVRRFRNVETGDVQYADDDRATRKDEKRSKKAKKKA